MDSWLTGQGALLNDKLQYCKPDPTTKKRKGLFFCEFNLDKSDFSFLEKSVCYISYFTFDNPEPHTG